MYVELVTDRHSDNYNVDRNDRDSSYVHMYDELLLLNGSGTWKLQDDRMVCTSLFPAQLVLIADTVDLQV